MVSRPGTRSKAFLSNLAIPTPFLSTLHRSAGMFAVIPLMLAILTVAAVHGRDRAVAQISRTPVIDTQRLAQHHIRVDIDELPPVGPPPPCRSRCRRRSGSRRCRSSRNAFIGSRSSLA